MKKTLRHPSIRPSHPAEIVADSLPALGLNKVEFAKALGISRNTLYNLLDQKQGVTAAMAVRLEAVLGSSGQIVRELITLKIEPRGLSDHPLV